MTAMVLNLERKQSAYRGNKLAQIKSNGHYNLHKESLY